MAVVVNMHQAKSQLSKLVERARKGEEVIIAKDGNPVARLVPIPPASATRPAGTYAGLIRIAENFDAPLPDEFTGVDE
jgi:prevent-host-death family protein